MSLQSIRQETDVAQGRAADPKSSAWVSANAGTGKTYVLVQRVLRLLLAGTQAEKILCLTFTKAAASEMANRLFRDLSAWTVLPSKELEEILKSLLGYTPKAEEMSRARQLFALALETPGGLKVQTIHAFCERLLQRFPLEAGIAPHFAVLDEELERTLKRQSIDQVLSKAVENEGELLGQALTAVIAYAGDTYFDDVLREALNNRDALTMAMRASLDGDGSLEDLIHTALGVSAAVSEEQLIADMAAALSHAQIDDAISALDQGKVSDERLADRLRVVRGMASKTGRYQALAGVFLTKDGKARSDKQFVTKDVREARPDVAQMLRDARDGFAELNGVLVGLRAVKASAALIRLADAVMQDYEHIKASRAVLDFDDLIRRTAGLLGQSQASAWVLYKLDGGIDHILVDEAQDTSPAAWDVIETLADEFFSGEGAREAVRTVFAVGDEKQSIYGFQGAAPKKFAAMGRAFLEKAETVSSSWHRVPLTLSFRSVVPVLQAVDSVFGGAEPLSGITAGVEEIRHHSNRAGQAGLVEIWGTEKPDVVTPADPWDPLAEQAEDDPIRRLAFRIADKIRLWLDEETELSSHGRPIREGDILILVRKRAPFAPAMIAALKSRGIAVAGADRIKLTEQLAVMDLMALGDFLLMPEDDLALATVLKSPLFDLDDDDLFGIGFKRKHSLWEAFANKAESNPVWNEAYETLRFFLARADLKPPYEFFESLLDWEGRRERFITRLGPEAGDAIDEFLNMALNYDDMAPSSLQGFIHWMRSSSADVKRDMEQGRDEVRVMTVHGAKGLEANIVIMPDTCSSKGAQRSQSVLALNDDGDDESGPLIWAIPSAKDLEAVSSARQLKRVGEQEEYHRLLYVAMTRARDRLYICGFETKRGRDKDCWYDLVRDRLEGQMTGSVDGKGRDVLRLVSAQSDAPDSLGDVAQEKHGTSALPEWAERKAPSEPVRTIPVAPSVAVPLEEDEEGAEKSRDEVEQTILPPRQMAADVRFLRGKLTHALLEHLPSIDRAQWEDAARRLVSVRGGDLSARARETIVSETLAILTDPQFSALFSSESMAEVPLTARIEPAASSGETPILLTGQIDRIAILDDEVLIVDYKTNRPPPLEAEGVAAAYLTQLSAYRIAIKKIYPDKQVKCAILWTDGPRMMEIPGALLDIYEKDLVELRKGRT